MKACVGPYFPDACRQSAGVGRAQSPACSARRGNARGRLLAYMLDAAPVEAPASAGLLTTGSAQNGKPSGFSLGRLLAFTAREAMQVRRDPVRLVFSFVGSALLLLIMSFGVSQEVRSIPFAAYDLDQSPRSRAYLSGFQDTPWFEEHAPITDPDAS